MSSRRRKWRALIKNGLTIIHIGLWIKDLMTRRKTTSNFMAPFLITHTSSNGIFTNTKSLFNLNTHSYRTQANCALHCIALRVSALLHFLCRKCRENTISHFLWEIILENSTLEDVFSGIFNVVPDQRELNLASS